MNTERHRQRQAAWLLASATTVILVLIARTVAAPLMWLLPLVLLPALLRWRAAPGRWWELGASLAAGGLGVLLASRFPPPPVGGMLGPLAAPILLVCLLLMLLRAWLRAPYRGIGPTLALGLLAATVAGGASLGWIYPVLCALYVGLALLALREAHPVRAAVQGWRQWRPAAALLGLSACIFGALAAGLPPLYTQLTQRAVSLLLERDTRIRFTESSMALGSLESVWQSDALIMRLHGASQLPHLRGSVHRRYADGEWKLERSAGGRALTPGPQPGQVRVEVLDRAHSPLLLPLGAELGGAAPTGLRADSLGIVRSDTGEPPARYSYTPGPAALPMPQAVDLQLPPGLRSRLSALAQRWLAGTGEAPAQRVARLQRRLEQDYVYSLAFRRRPGVDPVLDFLTGPTRQGHCEYFASALALLARSAGIPARVVRGYRPTGRNPWLGHVLVHERNAHAWVEVWVDGRWQTRDPTPRRSVAPAFRPSSVALLLDTLLVACSRAWAWLRAQGPVLPGMLVLAAALGWWWPRLRQLWPRPGTRGRRAANRHQPILGPLLAALARRRLRLAPGETLERFAARLDQRLPADLTAEACRLLQRYSALRYGGLGSAEALARDVEAFARRASKPHTDLP